MANLRNWRSIFRSCGGRSLDSTSGLVGLVFLQYTPRLHVRKSRLLALWNCWAGAMLGWCQAWIPLLCLSQQHHHYLVISFSFIRQSKDRIAMILRRHPRVCTCRLRVEPGVANEIGKHVWCAVADSQIFVWNMAMYFSQVFFKRWTMRWMWDLCVPRVALLFVVHSSFSEKRGRKFGQDDWQTSSS